MESARPYSRTVVLADSMNFTGEIVNAGDHTGLFALAVILTEAEPECFTAVSRANFACAKLRIDQLRGSVELSAFSNPLLNPRSIAPLSKKRARVNPAGFGLRST